MLMSGILFSPSPTLVSAISRHNKTYFPKCKWYFKWRERGLQIYSLKIRSIIHGEMHQLIRWSMLWNIRNLQNFGRTMSLRERISSRSGNVRTFFVYFINLYVANMMLTSSLIPYPVKLMESCTITKVATLPRNTSCPSWKMWKNKTQV